MGFGLDDRIYCTLYIHAVQAYTQHSTITILHTIQFTVTHAPGFSVFASCILAVGLSQSHCNFSSHMKSSWHCLIPFLPFLISHLWLPSPELDPILDYCSILRCTQNRRYNNTGLLFKTSIHRKSIQLYRQNKCRFMCIYQLDLMYLISIGHVFTVSLTNVTVRPLAREVCAEYQG
jgi:hypothetical protein